MRLALPRPRDLQVASKENKIELLNVLEKTIIDTLHPDFASVADQIIEHINALGYEFILNESAADCRSYLSSIPEGQNGGALIAFDLTLSADWVATRDEKEWTLQPMRSGRLDGLLLGENGRTRASQRDAQALLEGLLTGGVAPHLARLADELNQIGHALRLAHVGEISLGPKADSLFTGPHEILYNSERWPGLRLCCNCIATWSVSGEEE